MVNRTCQFTISAEPVPIYGKEGLEPTGAAGADVQFLGTVRGQEEGRQISGIEYSAYLPMAEKMLDQIRHRAVEEFGEHPVHIHHCTGFVAVGEPSILIRVAAKHSAQAFDICAWYLKAIKTSVPIWKKPVFVDASPSD